MRSSGIVLRVEWHPCLCFGST